MHQPSQSPFKDPQSSKHPDLLRQRSQPSAIRLLGRRACYKGQRYDLTQFSYRDDHMVERKFGVDGNKRSVRESDVNALLNLDQLVRASAITTTLYC
jgi:hypothetical protein